MPPWIQMQMSIYDYIRGLLCNCDKYSRLQQLNVLTKKYDDQYYIQTHHHSPKLYMKVSSGKNK